MRNDNEIYRMLVSKGSFISGRKVGTNFKENTS